MEKSITAGLAADDNIIWRMRFQYSITNATDTHSEYLIPIASPRRQWLRERVYVLLPVLCTATLSDVG